MSTHAFELASEIERATPEVALDTILETMLETVDEWSGGQCTVVQLLEKTVEKLR